MPSPQSETIAIVRSSNNQNIGEFIKRLSRYIPAILIIIYNESDKGLTRRVLHDYDKEIEGQYWVLEIGSRDDKNTPAYFLNCALAFVRGLNALGIKYQYVFNVSSGTRFERSHILKMLKQFNNPKVGIVGTTFEAWDDAHDFIPLGEYNTVCRNVGMMIRMDVFNSHSLLVDFDTFYDEHGGMEDVGFVRTAKAVNGWDSVLLDIPVSIKVIEHERQEFSNQSFAHGQSLVEERLANTLPKRSK